ncbi:MAG TPA: cell wall-binding repeat-containing protein [Acidimicrobiales bacterium]|nr:cell wall-binding repeat-containing protein [Acidimicrobiales bacterium]
MTPAPAFRRPPARIVAPLALLALAAAVIGARSTGATPPSAAARTAVPSPAQLDDPMDAAGGLDIRSVSWASDSATVTQAVRFWSGVGDARITYYTYLDTDGDGIADQWILVEYHPDAGAVVAGVGPAGTAHLRPAAVRRPDSTTVTVSFPRTWMGESGVSGWFVASAAPAGTGQPVVDLVPDVPTVRPPFPVRVAGTDRVQTAVSASFFADGRADAVVLARSDDFADALAGAPLAVDKHAPLLLTGSRSLDPSTLAEIRRVLAPGGTVYLLGGSGALSDDVESELDTDGIATIRYGGQDRFQTSLDILREGLGQVSTVLLATGAGFADALSAGAAAAAHRDGLLLTDGSRLPPATAGYLAAHPDVQTFAIGAPAARAAPAAVPVVGVDRYDTSARVATSFFSGPVVVGVATGLAFPDALAGSVTVGSARGPVLLTDPATLPPPVADYLRTLPSATVLLFGGSAAVGPAVARSVAAAVGR